MVYRDEYAIGIEFRHSRLDNLRHLLSGHSNGFNIEVLDKYGRGITIEILNNKIIKLKKHIVEVNNIEDILYNLNKINNIGYIHFNTDSKNIAYEGYEIDQISYILNRMSKEDKVNDSFVCNDGSEINIYDIYKELAILGYTDVDLSIINKELSQRRLLMIDGTARFVMIPK